MANYGAYGDSAQLGDYLTKILSQQGLIQNKSYADEGDVRSNAQLTGLLNEATQRAQLADDNSGRYFGDKSLLDALAKYGINSQNKGDTLELDGKKWLRAGEMDVNSPSINPAWVRQDPNYGTLIDADQFQAAHPNTGSDLSNFIGKGLEAGMVGAVGGLGAGAWGGAGDAALGTGTAATGTAVPGAYSGAIPGATATYQLGAGAAPELLGAGGAAAGTAAGAAATGLPAGVGTVAPLSATQASLGGLGALGGAAAGAGGLVSDQASTFGIPNNILSGAAQGIGGYLASQSQGDAYKGVADQYLGIGAPYRGQLEQSYQPGFNLASQPGYGDAFNRMADISSRSYSAKMGNPADNPTAQAGILSDVWNQGYLPALTNYRGQLGQFGGLGLNTSGSASMSGAGTAGGGWEAIGAGIGTALSPPKTSLNDLFKGSLSIGGMKYGG